MSNVLVTLFLHLLLERSAEIVSISHVVAWKNLEKLVMMCLSLENSFEIALVLQKRFVFRLFQMA